MGKECDSVFDSSFKKCILQILCTTKFVGTNPKIEVAGVGQLNYPVSESEASQFVNIGRLAPIADNSYRIGQEKLCRTWHLDLPEFNLQSSHFHQELSELVNDRLKLELGINKDEKIGLKLCKLLLHEEGGRPFAPFNDTNAPMAVQNANNNEEEEFVFATLSVLLPSREIVVAFSETELDFKTTDSLGSAAGKKSFYETFFSECHRMTARSAAGEANLALAYNLICSSENVQSPVTERRILISRAKQFLEHWRMDGGKHKCNMLSVVFEFKYTRGSLPWQCMNNQNKTIALAIIKAAREAKFDVYLSKFTCYERIGSHRCHWDDLDLCDGEKAYTFSNFLNVSTGEELERSAIHTLNGHPGTMKPFANKTHKTGFHCKNFQKRPANMKDRWSNHDALVLWPSENFDNILLKEELNLAVDFSLEWTKQLATLHPEDRCRNVFTASISRHQKEAVCFPINYISLDAGGNFDSTASIYLIDTFKRANNRHLFQLFVENVLKSRSNLLSASLLKELIDCSTHFGLDLASPIINTLFEDEKAFYVAVTLLRELCTSGASHYSNLISCIAPKLLDQLKMPVDCNEMKPKFNVTSLMGHDYKSIATATSLLCIYSSLGDSNWLLRVIGYIRQNPDRFPVNSVTVHALHHWNSWLDAELAKDPTVATTLGFAVEQKNKLIEDCIKQLKESSSEPPTEPQNWVRVANLSCQCADCKIIQNFLQHPTQHILNIIIEDDRKKHVLEVCKGILDLGVKLTSSVVVICKMKTQFEMQGKSYMQSMLAIENLQELLPADHPLHLNKENEAGSKKNPNAKIPLIKKSRLNNGQGRPKSEPHLAI